MHVRIKMEKEIINCEEKITSLERDSEGLMFAGRNGSADCLSLEKMKRRESRIKDSMDYRECIPCDKCSGGVEVRGFYKSGKEKIIK